jgi:hypothetical protein
MSNYLSKCNARCPKNNQSDISHRDNRKCRRTCRCCCDTSSLFIMNFIGQNGVVRMGPSAQNDAHEINTPRRNPPARQRRATSSPASYAPRGIGRLVKAPSTHIYDPTSPPVSQGWDLLDLVTFMRGGGHLCCEASVDFQNAHEPDVQGADVRCQVCKSKWNFTPAAPWR